VRGAKVVITTNASLTNGAQQLMAVDAIDLVSDAGGELRCCDHARVIGWGAGEV